VDWERWEQANQAQAQAAWRQYTLLRDRAQSLKDQRADLARSVEAKQNQMAHEAQQQAAKRLAEGHRVLVRDIPNWGPELQERLVDFGVMHGLSREELASIADPRHVKLLYLAHLGEQLGTRQRAAANPPRQQAQPVRQVGSRQSPGPGKDPDKMTDREWLNWRNSQIDRKAEAARKTRLAPAVR
jgi:hypothetical protein